MLVETGTGGVAVPLLNDVDVLSAERFGLAARIAALEYAVLSTNGLLGNVVGRSE